MALAAPKMYVRKVVWHLPEVSRVIIVLYALLFKLLWQTLICYGASTGCWLTNGFKGKND